MGPWVLHLLIKESYNLRVGRVHRGMHSYQLSNMGRSSLHYVWQVVIWPLLKHSVNSALGLLYSPDCPLHTPSDATLCQKRAR